MTIFLNECENKYIRNKVGDVGLMFQNLSYRTHGLILDLMNDKFEECKLTSSERGIEKNLVKLINEMANKRVFLMGLFEELEYLHKLTEQHYLGGG